MEGKPAYNRSLSSGHFLYPSHDESFNRSKIFWQEENIVTRHYDFLFFFMKHFANKITFTKPMFYQPCFSTNLAINYTRQIPCVKISFFLFNSSLICFLWSTPRTHINEYIYTDVTHTSSFTKHKGSKTKGVIARKENVFPEHIFLKKIIKWFCN